MTTAHEMTIKDLTQDQIVAMLKAVQYLINGNFHYAEDIAYLTGLGIDGTQAVVDQLDIIRNLKF